MNYKFWNLQCVLIAILSFFGFSYVVFQINQVSNRLDNREHILDTTIAFHSSTNVNMHQVLKNPKERVIIVGDVHGCMKELERLLKEVAFAKEKDTLVFVGDLVNKGPESLQVVRFARENAHSVRGNNDDMVSRAFFARQLLKSEGNIYELRKWKSYNFVDRFDVGDINWLRGLPYTISIPAFSALVVHAGLLPGRPLNSQTPYDMYSIRDVVPMEGHNSGPPWKASSLYVSNGFPWASEWRQKDLHVYFGHDSRRGLQKYKYATGLDTACVNGSYLTALMLPGNKITSIKCFKDYTKKGKI